ncbi:MAG: T9SS type A sorting domain-containing protein [Bacteroidota bacterium]
MKRKITIASLLLTFTFTGFATTWTIGNSGFTFTPATITITAGDTVVFSIASSHDAREVSQTTFNANGSAALSGGFQTAFGGGSVLPASLGVGTHYYVCSAHASMGMKGTIIVINSNVGIAENPGMIDFSISPNPSNGIIKLSRTNSSTNCSIKVFNLLGENVFQSDSFISEIDMNNQAKGLYFVEIKNELTVRTKKIIIQ